MHWHVAIAAFFSVFPIAYAATTYSSLGMQITFYVPHNAPGCATSIEGCVATSRPGLDGKSIPRSLDDVRAGRAKFVTLASCPNNYGKYFALGKITYRSAEDSQIHTVNDVVGYVHDTGGDFPNGVNKRGVHGCKKLDVNTTICYKCTSDRQAGALASGKNISFVPNGQGVGDPSLEGLYSQYGGLGYTGNAPYSPSSMLNTPSYPSASPLAPSQMKSPVGSNYSLPQPILSSSLLTAASPEGEISAEERPQSTVVSDLLKALAGPTTTSGALTVKSPLKLTESVDSKNASSLSGTLAATSSSGASNFSTAPPSVSTFSNSYQSPDLRWSTPNLFEPFFREVAAIMRSLIDLVNRL